MTAPPDITHTHTWDGTRDLPDWLHDRHHWHDDQLVIHTPDRYARPEPGWTLVLWTDGTVTVASPTLAERVYGTGGIAGRLARAERELRRYTEAESADAGSYAMRAEHVEATIARVQALADRWVKAGAPPLGTSISRWWDMRLAELHAALTEPEDTPMTGETPAYGCTIDGQPAMPILVAEYNQLVTRLAEAEAGAEQTAALAEQHARNTLTVARERETYRKAWKEAQRMRAKAEQRAKMAEPLLNDYRAELTRAEAAIARLRAALDEESYGGPKREDVITALRAALDQPGPAATQATEPATTKEPKVVRIDRAALGLPDRDAEPYPAIGLTNWTPPPPGDRREQLPDHILDLIRPYLRGYTSTACQTADYLTRAATDHPEHAVELGEWMRRMEARCRRNQKFTGEICPHHTVKGI